jgi:hypothetical protein
MALNNPFAAQGREVIHTQSVLSGAPTAASTGPSAHLIADIHNVAQMLAN